MICPGKICQESQGSNLFIRRFLSPYLIIFPLIDSEHDSAVA